MGTSAPLVLVADDEPSMLELVARHLRTLSDPKLEVIQASDGEEAWRLAREHLPDLVVLDVMMPYMDGFEVLKSLRREPETESLPVIMLTAKAQDKDVFEGYHYGADMYLTKPFNPMELVTFVKRIAQGGTNDGGPKRYEL